MTHITLHKQKLYQAQASLHLYESVINYESLYLSTD